MAFMAADSEELFGALTTPEGFADPYPIYRELHRVGPVIPVGDNLLLAVSYSAVDQLLRDNSLGVEPRHLLSGQASILGSNPPDHTRMRRRMSGAFTARRVQGLRAAIELQAAELINTMRDKGNQADIMADFAYRLPVNVICELLGVPVKDRTWFRTVASDYTVVTEGDFASASELAVAADAGELLRAYFSHLVSQRRAAPADDLISALAGADDLTEAELLGNLALLLIAGFETTTNLIGNGVMALFQHPGQAPVLASAPAAFVEEFLRYDSPVQLTSRVSLTSTVLAGRSVPPGTYINVLIGAANRDPARFADPDSFRPDRPDNTPISFGAGAHFCLGAALARLEAQIAFPLLLRHLPALRLDGTPLRRNRLVLRGYDSLPVAWN